MDFLYETEHLLLKIENESIASKVLDFYVRNQGYFELFEPIVASNFYTLDYHRSMLQYEFDAISKTSMVRFWIYDKNNPEEIIGTVSFRNISKSPYFSCCELGYKMDQKKQGYGYIQEALRCSISIVSDLYKIHRFEAYVQPDNLVSIHVLEKLGFENEGLLRKKVKLQGQWKDHALFAKIIED